MLDEKFLNKKMPKQKTCFNNWNHLENISRKLLIIKFVQLESFVGFGIPRCAGPTAQQSIEQAESKDAVFKTWIDYRNKPFQPIFEVRPSPGPPTTSSCCSPSCRGARTLSTSSQWYPPVDEGVCYLLLPMGRPPAPLRYPPCQGGCMLSPSSQRQPSCRGVCLLSTSSHGSYLSRIVYIILFFPLPALL